MKNFIKKNFSNLTFIYSYLGFKIVWLFLLIILVGFFDGFGLTMFLPLLKMVDGDKIEGNIDGLGNLSNFINWLHAKGVSINLNTILIFIFLLFSLKGIFKYFNGYYRISIQQRFIRKIREKTLNLFNKISFSNYLSSDIGQIQNSMSGEVERLARAFNYYFSTFEQTVFVFVYIFFAFSVDLEFAALVTLAGGLTFLIFNKFNRLTKIASLRLTDKSNLYQGQIIQHVGNFKYLRATALVDFYAKKLLNTIREIERLRKEIGIYSAFLQAIREPMIVGVIVLIIFLQVSVFKSQLGPIIISLIFFYRALTSITGVQTNWNKFLEVSGSMINIKEFQRYLKGSADVYGVHKFNHFNDELEVKNLSFSYDNSTQVLKNLSFKIRKNEVIAFVGESGSGKTTLVNILVGLLPVPSNSYFIDAIDKNMYDITTFQNKIGYVTQEPIIFNDTIFNNVTFWDEPTNHNKERFWSSVHNSSLYEYIMKSPEEEQTILGANGLSLSGGQKQRIAIARELYKDIDILILDEATSSLDTETEYFIKDSIEAFKGRFTIIIIAHRLSTIRNADKIFLFSKGEIVETGNFDYLKRNNPVFRSMVELQQVEL